MGTEHSLGIIIKPKHKGSMSGVAKIFKTTEPSSRDMDKIRVEDLKT